MKEGKKVRGFALMLGRQSDPGKARYIQSTGLKVAAAAKLLKFTCNRVSPHPTKLNIKTTLLRSV
jgi:hypothetical protein